MGNCFSDPSKGGERLGSAPSSSPASGQQARANAPAAAGGRGRPLSGPGPQSPGGGPPGGDPRAAAAAAAEARAQASILMFSDSVIGAKRGRVPLTSGQQPRRVDKQAWCGEAELKAAGRAA
ncbi:unnamed protein product [Cutaneotrichosporon oleaginosum]